VDNSIPTLPDTLGLSVKLHLTGPATRPEVYVQPQNHPLVREQMQGISGHRAHEYSPLFAMPADYSGKEVNMNPIKVVAIALIVGGVLGLLYGGFSYTKETHDVKIGPIEFSVKEKQDVNIPVWAGIGAIVVGGLLLVFGGRK